MHFIGQPPMQYLRNLRMQLASSLLAERGGKIAFGRSGGRLRIRGLPSVELRSASASRPINGDAVCDQHQFRRS